jgi:hypothetical protein
VPNAEERPYIRLRTLMFQKLKDKFLLYQNHQPIIQKDQLTDKPERFFTRNDSGKILLNYKRKRRRRDYMEEF